MLADDFTIIMLACITIPTPALKSPLLSMVVNNWVLASRGRYGKCTCQRADDKAWSSFTELRLTMDPTLASDPDIPSKFSVLERD